eukprot:s2638_g8.t1
MSIVSILHCKKVGYSISGTVSPLIPDPHSEATESCPFFYFAASRSLAASRVRGGCPLAIWPAWCRRPPLPKVGGKARESKWLAAMPFEHPGSTANLITIDLQSINANH